MKRYQEWTGGTFFETVTAAVADIAENGFDSAERLAFWTDQIRRAAELSQGSYDKLTADLKASLDAIFRREIDKGGLAKRHDGIPRYTLDRLRPQLQLELQRRVVASTTLIRLNREKAVNDTLQRFSGWASSVPPDGVPAEGRNEVKQNVGKALKQLPFEVRRVNIDQSAKLLAALDDTVAKASGAIAAVWHSHVSETGYDARPSHAIRNEKVYALPDTWAVTDGYINKGAGYTDEMTAPAQEINCRCYYRWLYSLGSLPDTMLTQKGRDFLETARSKRA